MQISEENFNKFFQTSSRDEFYNMVREMVKAGDRKNYDEACRYMTAVINVGLVGTPVEEVVPWSQDGIINALDLFKLLEKARKEGADLSRFNVSMGCERCDHFSTPASAELDVESSELVLTQPI